MSSGVLLRVAAYIHMNQYNLYLMISGHRSLLESTVTGSLLQNVQKRATARCLCVSSLCPRCFRVGLPLGAHPHPNLRSNLLPHNLLVFFYCTATCALSLCSKCLLRKFSTQLVRRFRNSAYCPTQVFHLHLVLVPYAVLLFRLVLFTLWL